MKRVMMRLLWVPALFNFTVAYTRLRLIDMRGGTVYPDTWIYESIRCRMQRAYDLGSRARGGRPYETRLSIEDMISDL